MSQKDQGNKASERGMPKNQDKGQAGKETIKGELHVGSVAGGIRFPVHNYDGMAVEHLNSPEK